MKYLKSNVKQKSILIHFINFLHKYDIKCVNDLLPVKMQTTDMYCLNYQTKFILNKIDLFTFNTNINLKLCFDILWLNYIIKQGRGSVKYRQYIKDDWTEINTQLFTLEDLLKVENIDEFKKLLKID